MGFLKHSPKPGGYTLPIIALMTLFVVLGAGTVSAQTGEPPQAPRIDNRAKGEIIDSVTATLNEYYVFPEVAKKMEQHVREQFKDGAYDDISTTDEFATQLTKDLLDVCHDRHLGLRYVPKERLEALLDTLNRPTREDELTRGRFENFGFKKVEVLPGNVGYLKFNEFSGFREAGPTAIAAMNFLGNSDAIIFDLRDNGGGSPAMIQILSSYLFDEPVHLNTFYIRETDSLRQFWTTNFVEGPKLTDIPIYVLTSNYTFSGAEEFTFNLKNLERATIVGETTGGGAHPVSMHGFPNLEIGIGVPFGRAINPVTGTNWEGTGIEPNIACDADGALDVALLDCYEKMKDKTDVPQKLAAYDWQILDLKAKSNPVTVDEQTLQRYAGSYGPRQVTFEDGALYYQREDRPKYKLVPLTQDMFAVEGLDYFRVRFVTDENGSVKEIEGHYAGGRTDSNARDS